MLDKERIQALIARRGPMSAAEQRAQLCSITYGNLALEYPNLTRSQVEEVVRKLERSR